MMSEYYDHYHRWEPLAEFHFNLDSDEEEFDDDNYLYCLCSRAFIRDNVKTYYVEKEEGSESDVEVLRDSHSQDWDDHSHVHFSLDTSYKVKCEKDEGASCYCSASHTDNCCSTDEQDPALHHGTMSHALQPSDSGADLTYQDCHSDYTTHDRIVDQDFQIIDTNEDYLLENTWEKFWALHGERIIWASWIKKYSDYINPEYLNENKELSMDENSIPKQHSAEPICQEYIDNEKNEDNFRERKFSYDSKVNPYKRSKARAEEKVEKSSEIHNKEEQWLPIGRRRSCSEQDRILSPRTIAGTDSMTNVTKITLSSYDVTSSHVTSESTPTDDYSVSSSPSDDQSNDQTRITNVEYAIEQTPSEEMDTEQYWQFLWKKHFGELYALHYANYIEQHNAKDAKLPEINIEIIDHKEYAEKADLECENSEGNSTEMPTIIENQTEIDQTKVEVNTNKPKKRNKKVSNRYIDSVGVLLQNLLKEEQKKKEESILEEPKDAGDGNENKNETEPVSNEVIENTSTVNIQQSISNNDFTSYSYDGGDDDPPEETPIMLKRSHELDDEEIISEKIKSTFEIMGFCVHADKMPKGQLVYRKRLARLRPPRYKKFNTPKKTYFDDDGNPYQLDQYKDSQDEREIPTDDDCQENKSEIEDTHGSTSSIAQSTLEKDNSNNKVEAEKALDKEDITVNNNNKQNNTLNNDEIDTADTKEKYILENKENTSNVKEDENEVLPKIKDKLKEAADVPLPFDSEANFSDVNEHLEKNVKESPESAVSQETTKRRRRQKRHSKAEDESFDVSELPPELRDDPKMLKYWKKRHSLFHRFDEGIQLDRESWFSVTPENVARHIATKCAYDTVLDAFCGAGGNTIQFARTCKKVIAVDIDPAKIQMAKHNATVYGVADCIEFIVGDFFEIAHTLTADMVFLSPPWGGPGYSANDQYDLETMLEPKPASELIDVAKDISPTIALYLPRNTRPDQILSLAKGLGGSVEVEQSFLDKRFVAITAYFY